jgi:TrmH family RNA methyltransferase
MPQTLGAHSPKLDAVRALKTKAGRREQGRFAVEGPTMLAEALRSGSSPGAVYTTAAAADAAGPLLAGLGDDVEVFLIPDRAMDRLSDLETAPGILAVFRTSLVEPARLLATGGILLLLAGLGDPGNAGTLLRSAEIFGFSGILFGDDGVEPYNPKVVRASMGAIFRVPLGVAGPADLSAAARQAGYELVATGEGGTPLPDFRFSARSIVAVGNERRGVAGWLPSWDRTVTIPQRGAGESLNAAVAGSIVAYVASNQLNQTPPK